MQISTSVGVVHVICFFLMFPEPPQYGLHHAWSQGPHHQPAAACTARFALRDNHIGPGGTDWPRGVKTTPGKFSREHARRPSGCIVCKPTLTVPDVLLDRCKLLSYVLQ